MANNKISHVGGAKLERGNFEVYVGPKGSRAYLEAGPLKEHIKEHWMFLMTDYASAEIAGRTVTRELSKSGLQYVAFFYLQHRVLLYKKGDSFATFVLEIPFVRATAATEGNDDEAYAGVIDDEDNGMNYGEDMGGG
ncbi:MAG: hypothetical protein E6R03_10265 [Hyphomicrobiaceae bacterium]|nr:MAG: hypothetical protein E6R03_10265 [Hyphomicrobiaceae bacterium]